MDNKADVCVLAEISTITFTHPPSTLASTQAPLVSTLVTGPAEAL